MQALMVAIVARWNAAALNTSIAELYSGGPANKTANAAGSPAGTAKPRAEFEVQIPRPALSRGSRIAQAVAIIKVWGKPELVPGYMTSIRDKFINSEVAVSNPMTMVGGSILGVDDGGEISIKVDDQLSMGRQMLLIRHQISNARPA